MITTFVAPPALRALLKQTAQAPQELDSALCDVVTEAMEEDDERRQGDRRRPEAAVR